MDVANLLSLVLARTVAVEEKVKLMGFLWLRIEAHIGLTLLPVPGDGRVGANAGTSPARVLPHVLLVAGSLTEVHMVVLVEEGNLRIPVGHLRILLWSPLGRGVSILLPVSVDLLKRSLPLLLHLRAV